MAALVASHDPGWRLPQPTALARRFSVSLVEIERVIDELARRHLVRELPDGKLYRASPADYVIALEGIPGIGASIDPMGASVTCISRRVSWKRVPEDVAEALCLAPTAEASIIRCHWAANGRRAAVSTTYLASARPEQASAADCDGDPLGVKLPHAPPAPGAAPGTGPVPTAAYIELQVPPPWAARSLELSPGEPAITLSLRFRDPSTGRPVALTTASLRAGLFRVILDTANCSGKPGLADRAGYVAEWDQ